MEMINNMKMRNDENTSKLQSKAKEEFRGKNTGPQTEFFKKHNFKHILKYIKISKQNENEKKKNPKQ